MQPALVSRSCAYLYAASFIVPLTGTMYGWEAFVASLMFPFVWPIWAANPLFWTALHRFNQQRYESSANLAFIACVLAGTGLVPIGGPLECGPAYWMWVAPMAALAVASVRFAKTEKLRSAYPVVPTRSPASINSSD